jgi:hypothetical protein
MKNRALLPLSGRKDGLRKDSRTGTSCGSPLLLAADVVVEQLGEARHKRPHCLHITIVPRLMDKQMEKRLAQGVGFGKRRASWI